MNDLNELIARVGEDAEGQIPENWGTSDLVLIGTSMALEMTRVDYNTGKVKLANHSKQIIRIRYGKMSSLFPDSSKSV